VPPLENFQPQWLNQAGRYYGLVGLLVGAISASVLLASGLLFPAGIAIILAMISSVLLTGGFHEDGLADTFDGFGGGWSIEQKLTIMKDSRLGTYGALALVLGLGFKFVLLIEISRLAPSLAPVAMALVIGHCVSRVMAVSFIFDQPYVRDIDSSKIKPMTEQQSPFELMILLLSAMLPLLFVPFTLAIALIAGLWLLRYLLIRWYHQQIGGYTGDLLGAAQQMAELSCYLILLAYWR
jgi:adenosylcobinamide-GDP ribazoletransferase